MSDLIKVYLDDERITPEDWTRTYNIHETIDLLKTYKVSHLSIDNDLGIIGPDGLPDPKEEGFNVINWLEEELHTNEDMPCPEITMHSSNTGRKSTTLLAIRSINEKFSHRKIV